MDRILLLDSDPTFSETIQDGFERLGAEVQTVQDGNMALQAAKEFRPDLILLSVELQNLNGWVVCKKIRAAAQLKDTPLIVLSSDATEDIFEQHRRLSARADDYVHKPISFETLLEHVRQVMPFDDMVAESADDSISVDSSGMYVEEDDDEAVAVEGVDSEIEEFAESAFGSLIIRDPQGATSGFTDKTDTNFVPPTMAGSGDLGFAGEQHSQELAQLRKELTAAREEIMELMDTAKRRAAEADKLHSEVESLRGKATQEKSVAAVSGRELLDLRESLNRKDKEILDLRDQVTSRDRQLIESSDNMLKGERERNDLRERLAGLEKDLEAGREQNTGLVADKAKLSQRVGELRERAESAEAQVQQGEEALAAARNSHTQAMEELKALSAAELEAQRKDLEAEAEARLEELASTKRHELEKAAREHEDAVVALRDKLQQKHDTEVKHLQTKHAEELALLGRRLADIESQLENAQDALRAAESSKADIQEQLSATIVSLQAQHDAVRQERDVTVEDLRGARDQVQALQKLQEDNAMRLGNLERMREEVQAKLDAAVNKMSLDEEFLQRARKAIAITATLLDEQKNNRFS